MGNVQQYIGKRVEVGKYQVEAIKYLGEGGSSFIFLVKDVLRDSAKPMVLKRLVAESDAAFTYLQREIEMHQRFRHGQIVEFYASQVNKRPKNEREVFILMEYCPQGHLYENMMKMGAKRYSEKDLLRLFRSLCVPVSLLHSWDPPIAHRDLKLENFLLAQNGVYKLCDFGSCVDGPQSLKTKADRAIQAEHVDKRTTAMYRSPELADIDGTAMFGSGELTEAVDVWAMGCVLYTMAFFKSPFPPDGLRTERYTIPKESKYSADLHQLIARMLQADVERRATILHVIDCIDAMLDGQPLPKNEGAHPTSPKKAAAPPPVAKKPAPASREGSFETPATSSKTTEARKESVPVAKKSPAADLLDMDFNPTISTPPPKAATASASTGWTTAAAPETFADFANFPTSPSKFGAAAAVAPTSSSFDAFGFPASPVKQPTAAPAFGFTNPPPQQHMPMLAPVAAADPFAGLSAMGGPPMGHGMGGYRPQPQQQQPYGMAPQQGFHQPMMPHMQQQQQPMWGQPQHQHQQQPPPQWGQPQPHGSGGFPRGY